MMAAAYGRRPLLFTVTASAFRLSKSFMRFMYEYRKRYRKLQGLCKLFVKRVGSYIDLRSACVVEDGS